MKAMDEFTYPPRVQEALDLVERETKRLEREARQEACSHDSTVNVRSVSDPVGFKVCTMCGIDLSQDAYQNKHSPER